MNELHVGDRFTYITPSGREIPETVVAVDVWPRYQAKPGQCVKLRSEDSGWETVLWPEDVLSHPEWWRRELGDQLP